MIGEDPGFYIGYWFGVLVLGIVLTAFNGHPLLTALSGLAFWIIYLVVKGVLSK